VEHIKVATKFLLKYERKMAKLEPSASRLKYERKLEQIRSLQAPLLGNSFSSSLSTHLSSGSSGSTGERGAAGTFEQLLLLLLLYYYKSTNAY
jgi:hypothetical protein